MKDGHVIPEPIEPVVAWRGHLSHLGETKRAWTSYNAARKWLRKCKRTAEFRIYECAWCGQFHIATRRGWRGKRKGRR